MSRPRIATCLLLLAACSSDSTSPPPPPPPPPPTVASIAVTPPTSTITVGATATLTASARDANGAALVREITNWSTSNAAVATVSAAGVVRGEGAGGPVTITATYEGKSGTAQITVSPVPVTTVEVSPPAPTLTVGATVQLTAVTKDAGGGVLTGRTVTWTPGNPAIATVNAAGLVTAVAAGTTTITATSEGRTAVANLAVNAPAPTIQSMTVGAFHTCALKSDGTAWCWGVNFEGRIGNGTTTHQLLPVAVSGGHRFKSLVAGSLGTCGIDINDVVRCWGAGTNGNLGNGSLASLSVPGTVTSAGEVMVQVAPSPQGSNTCALSVTSKVYCWGEDPTLLLTGSINVVSPTFLPIGATPPPVELSIGRRFGCGRMQDGTAWCWGANGVGQLGDGTTSTKQSPVQVSGAHVFTKVRAGGSHSCGLKANGTIWCWGDNENGLVGDGTLGNFRVTPQQVVGITDFVDVGLGLGHSCGLRANGSAWCWGSNNLGQLGDGSIITRSAPVAVSGGKSFTRIGGGGVHSCGLASDGVWCWGGNAGQIGDGTEIARPAPVKVLGLTGP